MVEGVTKRYKKTILLFCLFIITGLILFRGFFLYSADQTLSIDVNSENMRGYKWDDRYLPVQEDANIYVYGFSMKIDEIHLKFDQKLSEDVTVYLFNALENETRLISSKVIRKGYKSADFFLAEEWTPGIMFVIRAVSDGHLVEIPVSKIILSDKKMNVLQRNVRWIVLVGLLCVVSAILALVISRKGQREKIIVNSSVRQSNFELLRVICMMFLVAHHFSVHGGLLGLEDSMPKKVGLIFLPPGKICFIAFIAISMYFLVDGEARFKRFFKSWMEVVFYSVLLTIVTWMMGGMVSVKDFISSFFVMIGNSHGFAASYLLFLCLFPFLSKVTHNLTKFQARYLLLALFWIQILSQILKALTYYNQPVYSELTLFVFCYILSLNLKRYPIKLLDNKWFDLLLVLSIWAYVFVLNTVAYKGGLNEYTSFFARITADESSIFFIIGGYALFYLFKNINVPYCKWINTVAQGTFGILLMHDHNFFRGKFWSEVVKTQTFYYSPKFVILFGVSVICVFVVCSVLDYLRREFLEKPIFNSKYINAICTKMDGELNKNEDKE